MRVGEVAPITRVLFTLDIFTSWESMSSDKIHIHSKLHIHTSTHQPFGTMFLYGYVNPYVLEISPGILTCQKAPEGGRKYGPCGQGSVL